jgi:hypothetical protein
MPITIADHTLSRLVAQTKPHVAGRYEPEAVQVVSFEFDGTYLYAWATNRFTLAVARTQAKGADQPWTAIVNRQQLPELEAAVRLLDHKSISIERAADQLVFSGQGGTRVAIDLVTGKEPIAWRTIVLPAVERKAAALPMTLQPSFFGAWKNLPAPVAMWSTGDKKPALIVAADFLGLQMPIVRPGDADAINRDLATWRVVGDEPLSAAA